MSDLAGKLDIVVLILLSIISWYIMIGKYGVFRRVKRLHAGFEHAFAGEQNPGEEDSPLHRIFAYAHSLARREIPEEKLAVYVEHFAARELDELETNLTFLSVTSVVAPLLGLLGTVWGLLVAFHAMALAGSSSIKVVAAGVAEALITTVVGLLVAVPAAVAFTYFSDRLRKIAGRVDFLLPQIVAAAKQSPRK